MERNIIGARPSDLSGSSVCGLVVLVELATALTIAVAVLSAADPGEVTSQSHSVGDAPGDVDNADSSRDSETPLHPQPQETDASDPDSALARQMLGVWEDDYEGHRILTLRADGTGTMVVELDGFAAAIFAAKLTFQEEWSVENERVTMKATGGEPAGKVRLVLSIHGDSSTQRIVEVTDDRMILVEEPSEKRFEWRRVKELIQHEPQTGTSAVPAASLSNLRSAVPAGTCEHSS